VRLSYIAAHVLLALTLASPVAADPAERSGHRHDYSRFSDGPRNVPTPRGASLQRAQALGLGTREAATQLMHGQPEARWLRAAAWREAAPDRLLWPVDDGNYVRGFGYVRTTRPDLRHDGVDISAPVGTVVRAAADGIVAYSDNGIRGYGNCVLILHPNGWVTLYAHNSRTTVQPGWRVRRGERIALVGSTGISRGPHVHFELIDGGRATDPLALFDGGPAFVRRVAERAHAAGRVPEPERVTAADRPTPPPLADAQPRPAPTVDRRALVRRLLRFAPTEAMREEAGGRIFSNLLWPARGGALAAHDRRGARITAEDGTAVRAAADGQIVYVGRLGRRGRSVVMLHRMGWVTVYTGVGEVHVEPGQRVERGEWIAATDGRLGFEVRVDGRPTDPSTLLVHVPSD